MGTEFSVEGRRVTVVGAARSGVAAAELLARRGAEVTLSDARDDVADTGRLAEAGVRLELGGHQERTFSSADLLVVSPGVPPAQPFVAAAEARGVPVIGELELASRWLRGRVIAITGTKGKSTTTTLTGQMLQRSGVTAIVGGNIGVPLCAQVDESTPDTVHVVEASSFQLFRTDRFHPWVAAVLNFSADHLDWHPTTEHYLRAKARVFANQQPEDWAVVNADDAGAIAVAAGAPSRRRWFGYERVTEGVTVADGQIVERSGRAQKTVAAVEEVRVAGRHMLSDVLAATAISRLAGATRSGISETLAAFTGLEHAMELAGEVGGVRFVNDSKATNIESARRSIESVPSRLVVILGGRYKGGDFRELLPALAGRALGIVAIGEAAALIEEALAGAVPVVRASSMDAAVRAAFGTARPSGTVVLAPACSSFDMFADYRERGERFKEGVKRLAAEWRAAGES